MSNNLVATKSPNKKKKKKRFGGHQIILCNLAWNDLVATKFLSEKKKKKPDLVATKSSFTIKVK